MRRYTVLVLALLAVGGAWAKSTDESVRLSPDEPAAAQLDRLEAALRSENYSEMTLEDKNTVQQAIGRIRLKMEGHSRFDELNPQARTAIFNDQEVVNTVMTRAKEDSRMVCRRERVTGSNMQQSTCRTVAQRRRDTEDSRRLLDNQQRGNQTIKIETK
jgi:outer membrane lipoprotein-sorting protein